MSKTRPQLPEMRIQVMTHRTGYTLRLEAKDVKNEFIYRDVESLTLGMIHHLIDEFTDYTDLTVIADAYADHEALVNLYKAKLQAEHIKTEAATAARKKQNARNKELVKEITELHAESKQLKSRVAALEKALENHKRNIHTPMSNL